MLCIEGIFENVIRIAKPPLNIAYSSRVVGVDVVNRGGELWQALIILESFVKLRRALGDRDQGIEHGRQFFVFYLDILCRFFCNVFVFGCNDRDFFTDEADSLAAEHRHVSQSSARQNIWNICRGQNRHDSGLRLCS